MTRIPRRRFLAGTAASALGLSGCFSGGPPWRGGSAGRARAPRKIVVIGAGLAGLAAGYELVQVWAWESVLARAWGASLNETGVASDRLGAPRAQTDRRQEDARNDQCRG